MISDRKSHFQSELDVLFANFLRSEIVIQKLFYLEVSRDTKCLCIKYCIFISVSRNLILLCEFIGSQ